MLFIIVTFLLLESLLILALEAIYTLSEYKLDITVDLYIENITKVFTNLGSYIQTNWEQKNPFFLIGTGAIFIYSIVLHIKGKKRKSDWETQEEGYHGSAKWSKPRDIIDNKNFEAQSKKEIQTNFYKSLE